MSTQSEDTGLGFRFWVGLSLAILGIGIAAFIGFLLFSKAVYAWGFLGGFFVFSLVLIGFGWLYDRRNAQQSGDVY